MKKLLWVLMSLLAAVAIGVVVSAFTRLRSYGLPLILGGIVMTVTISVSGVGNTGLGTLIEIAIVPALIAGLHQFIDQRGGGGEADRHPLLAGGQTQAEGDMGLAGSTRPEGDDVLPPVDLLAGRRCLHRRKVIRSGPVPAPASCSAWGSP